jgi:hypothetical protein
MSMTNAELLELLRKQSQTDPEFRKTLVAFMETPAPKPHLSLVQLVALANDTESNFVDTDFDASSGVLGMSYTSPARLTTHADFVELGRMLDALETEGRHGRDWWLGFLREVLDVHGLTPYPGTDV